MARDGGGIDGRNQMRMCGILLTGAVSVVAVLGACPVPASAETLEHGEQSRARFAEGVAQWKSGDRAAALASFEASADRMSYAAPVGGYEFVFARKGEAWLQGAREDFRAVLLGPPDEAEAHFFVGNVLKFRNLWRDAVEEYREAIRLKPGHAKAHFHLGHEWARLLQWESAVGPLRAATTLAPNDPAPHMLLAIVLGQLEKTSALGEAVREAQEGVRLLPDSPQAHWILGHAYLALVRCDEAAAEFRTYLALEKPGPMTDSGIERANELLRQMAPYLSP